MQVGHRPLHIEDRLLMLQELLPTTVQGQVHLLQVLDFPLKFQRGKKISGHRDREGASGHRLLVLPGPLSPPWAFCLVLPAQPLGYCFPLLLVRRSQLKAGEPLGYLCTKWLPYQAGPAYPCPTPRVGHCPASLTLLYSKILPRPRKQTLLLFSSDLKSPEARLLIAGHS